MSHPQRKRGYSQAFQLAMNTRQAQIPRIMTARSLSERSTPIRLDRSNKENGSPFDQNKHHAARSVHEASQLNFHWAPGLTPYHQQQTKSRGTPLQPLVQLPVSNVKAQGGSLLPIGRDSFRPELTLSSTPPEDGDILGFLDSEPGPAIYEDNAALNEMSLPPIGPLTPSELPIQDLSLIDVSSPDHVMDDVPSRLLPERPNRPFVPRNRTTVHVGPSHYWAKSFTAILPEDIIVVFGKGKQIAKVKKYPLCAASRFFKSILDFPFRPGHTPTLRLRDDFPYGIHAMLTFMDRGTYAVQSGMRTEYPTATMLDLHIHAYLAGTKYAVPDLALHARTEYIALGDMSLQTKFANALEVSRDVMAYDSFRPDQEAGTAIVKAFLESLALLWNNTPNREDALRAEAIELLKHHLTRLVKVPFFGVLMREVDGFGRDIEGALGDDGLVVSTFLANEGEEGKVRFA